MSEDVFFRGGIAKGNLYQKEKYQFYGNSVIYAYLLENNISHNPIIIIDSKTDKDLQQEKDYNELIKHKGNRVYLNPFVQLRNSKMLDLYDYSIIRKIDKSKIISYLTIYSNEINLLFFYINFVYIIFSILLS